MIVHLNQIPPEGLRIEGEDPPEILGAGDLRDLGMRPLGPVAYALDVGVSGEGIFATGHLSVPIEMECVRCLGTFRREIRVDRFALQTELTGAEAVDLTPFVREDIFLALPPHPHCDWDGKTECPGLRREPGDEGESPGEKPAVWDALDHLKLGEKE
jgi:uncharacterized metal-binding protein YceD (DUF177 family)